MEPTITHIVQIQDGMDGASQRGAGRYPGGADRPWLDRVGRPLISAGNATRTMIRIIRSVSARLSPPRSSVAISWTSTGDRPHC